MKRALMQGQAGVTSRQVRRRGWKEERRQKQTTAGVGGQRIAMQQVQSIQGNG